MEWYEKIPLPDSSPFEDGYDLGLVIVALVNGMNEARPQTQQMLPAVTE